MCCMQMQHNDNGYQGCVRWRTKTSSEQRELVYGSQEMFSLKPCVLFTCSTHLRDSFAWWEREPNFFHTHPSRDICTSGILILAVCVSAAGYMRKPFNEVFDKSHHFYAPPHQKKKRLRDVGEFRGVLGAAFIFVLNLVVVGMKSQNYLERKCASQRVDAWSEPQLLQNTQLTTKHWHVFKTASEGSLDYLFQNCVRKCNYVLTFLLTLMS